MSIVSILMRSSTIGRILFNYLKMNPLKPLRLSSNEISERQGKLLYKKFSACLLYTSDAADE